MEWGAAISVGSSNRCSVAQLCIRNRASHVISLSDRSEIVLVGVAKPYLEFYQIHIEVAGIDNELDFVKTLLNDEDTTTMTRTVSNGRDHDEIGWSVESGVITFGP